MEEVWSSDLLNPCDQKYFVVEESYHMFGIYGFIGEFYGWIGRDWDKLCLEVFQGISCISDVSEVCRGVIGEWFHLFFLLWSNVNPFLVEYQWL